MTVCSGLPVLMASLVLLSYPNDISMDCTEINFRLFPAQYNLNSSNPKFKLKKNENLPRCGRLCSSEEFCDIWKFDPSGCQLFHSIRDNVFTVIDKENSTKRKIYYKIHQGEEWTKIFFFKAGSKISVVESFMDSSWKIYPDTFRSFLIDLWANHITPRKVKLSLLQNNKEVRFITFNAERTMKETWFNMGNVIQSSWNDLRPGMPHGKFKFAPGYSRMFVAELTSGKCSSIAGWLTVVNERYECEYGINHTYPYIMYSNQPTAVNWTEGFGIADALAVYVSF